jgi:gluconate:H+ symporter, GntP family
MNVDASSFMNISLLQVIACLLAGIACIILLTVRFHVHPFFALLIACFVTGMGMQMSFEPIIGHIKTGMGDILSKLTLIIVLGTTIGVLLERNGATQVMANSILKLVGTKQSSLALSITGFIVGLPIFCDSGYIVLNGINKSLARQTAFTIAQMSISLASGLYAVHCLLPPHPGATAAAATFDVQFGRVIVYGLIVAIPAMLIGHWWAIRAGKNSAMNVENEDTEIKEIAQARPSAIAAFLPVVIPIVLMALGSMTKLETNRVGSFDRIVGIAGEPSVALAIGVLLALVISKDRKKNLSHYLALAVEKAGGILVIIAAGGAFGAVLAATNIGAHFSQALDLKTVGIWFPFLLTCILKTAQGSSTVAIVTASTILLPLLPALGMDSDNGRLLSVLAMGAGSMMISHTNDAYFWVIAKFSSIDIKTMLKVHTIASVLMGIVTMIIIYLFSLFIL